MLLTVLIFRDSHGREFEVQAEVDYEAVYSTLLPLLVGVALQLWAITGPTLTLISTVTLTLTALIYPRRFLFASNHTSLRRVLT